MAALRFALLLVPFLVLLPGSASADFIFTFSPAAGGSKTRVTLTDTGGTLALGAVTGISDNTLSFNFLPPAIQSFEFPDPGNFIVVGSVSGARSASRLLVDDDSPGTDDLQLDFLTPLVAGETLTLAGSLTTVGDIAFSNFLGAGAASNPIGAQFSIVLSSTPVPEAGPAAGLALAFGALVAGRASRRAERGPTQAAPRASQTSR